MPEIPSDNRVESLPGLLRDGYLFIPKRIERHRSNVFRARLLFENTLFMSGEEAARVFYDTNRFRREDAAPMIIKHTLFGVGGVQGLDGEAHRVRKRMLMSLMSTDGIQRLVDLAAGQWHAALPQWESRERIVLKAEMEHLLCRAVTEWAGIPVSAAEVERWAKALRDLFESPGAVGLKHVQGRLARRRMEQWLGDLVERVRRHEQTAEPGSALHTIAWHRNAAGDLLEPRIAAVELLNVLRPTVAVSRYIVFCALALHDHPTCRQRLLEGGDEYAEHFVQEVRRFYPFFPFVAARVRRNFSWNGFHFQEGVRVILDLYGTNHDPRLWREPDTFRPERFQGWEGDPFQLIPQGGGDHYLNHRCPGEWITIALMKMALDMLTRTLRYDVPEQDLSIDLATMPAIPASGFVMAYVRRLQ